MGTVIPEAVEHPAGKKSHTGADRLRIEVTGKPVQQGGAGAAPNQPGRNNYCRAIPFCEGTKNPSKQIQGLGEFARWGFMLEHPDDHIVELHHQGEFVARFSQIGVTEQAFGQGVPST